MSSTPSLLAPRSQRAAPSGNGSTAAPEASASPAASGSCPRTRWNGRAAVRRSRPPPHSQTALIGGSPRRSRASFTGWSCSSIWISFASACRRASRRPRRDGRRPPCRAPPRAAARSGRAASARTQIPPFRLQRMEGEAAVGELPVEMPGERVGLGARELEHRRVERHHGLPVQPQGAGVGAQPPAVAGNAAVGDERVRRRTGRLPRGEQPLLEARGRARRRRPRASSVSSATNRPGSAAARLSRSGQMRSGTAR